MVTEKTYVARCAIALGKSVIPAGAEIPTGVSAKNIQALLSNGSIDTTEAKAAPQGADTKTTTKPKSPDNKSQKK